MSSPQVCEGLVHPHDITPLEIHSTLNTSRHFKSYSCAAEGLEGGGEDAVGTFGNTEETVCVHCFANATSPTARNASQDKEQREAVTLNWALHSSGDALVAENRDSRQVSA